MWTVAAKGKLALSKTSIATAASENWEFLHS